MSKIMTVRRQSFHRNRSDALLAEEAAWLAEQAQPHPEEASLMNAVTGVMLSFEEVRFISKFRNVLIVHPKRACIRRANLSLNWIPDVL